MPCVREFGPPTPSLNKILQIRHTAVENKLVMSKKLIEKLTKYKTKNKKNWDCQPTKHCKKRYNLRSSTYQNATLTKFQVLLLTKGPKFCPTTKRNVFDIKSDTKELARKLKMREI